MDMFVFCAGNEYYAFNIEKVKEVAELRQFVLIPRSLEYIKGVMNYKGALYCIIDTFSFFNIKAGDTLNCDIIILSDTQYKIGFLAERIIGAVNVSKLKSKSLPKAKDDLIMGYYKLNDNEVRLIDTEKLLKTIEDAVYNTNLTL
jgi:purine-binding chemotaxis protein CheW